jgi:hypothetical protein
MASAIGTTDHGEIRRWVEARGGIPTIVKGTEGLLRIDFVRGAQSGGREPSLEEIDWDRWFDLFDKNQLRFLCSLDKRSKFFKLVSATGTKKPAATRVREDKAAGRGQKKNGARTGAGRKKGQASGWNKVAVTREDGAWVIEVKGQKQRKSYSTKADAVRHAREVARRNSPAELVIGGAGGRDQERVHYGHPEQHATH